MRDLYPVVSNDITFRAIRVAVNNIVANTVAVTVMTKVSVSINAKIKGGDAPIIRNNLISSFLSRIELSKNCTNSKAS